MPGPALTYLMTVSQKLTTQTLDNILTKATTSTDGNEYERMWQATSWTDLLSSGMGVIASSAMTIGSSATNWLRGKKEQATPFQVLSAEGRRMLINEVANDPDLPQFIKNNKELVSCALKHALAANVRDSRLGSRTIDNFVGVLPNVVKSLQERGCLKNIININDLSTVIISTLIQDASNTTPGSNLYESSREVTEKFLEMAAAHPEAVKNVLGRVALSTDSPSHQQNMIVTIKNLPVSQNKSIVGPDGIARQDLSNLCKLFREKSQEHRMLLDTPIESALHQLNFDNLSLDAQTIQPNIHVSGFTFRDAKLFKGFPPDNSCFIKCDFSFVSLEDGVSFNNCTIDAQSFKTLVPSLRVAKAEGKIISLAGLQIHGDLSAAELSFLDLSNSDMSNVTGMTDTNIHGTLLDDTNIPGVIVKKASLKPTITLTSTENDTRKKLSSLGQKGWTLLSQSKTQIRTTKQAFDNTFVHNSHSALSAFTPQEQNLMLYTLAHNDRMLDLYVQNINSGFPFEESLRHIDTIIKQTPEFDRQYQRALKQDASGLDPFTQEVRFYLAHTVSVTELHVLTRILQEHTQTLSKKYDKFEGTPQKKVELLLKQIKTTPEFKFQKEVIEFKQPTPYFADRHIESLRELLIDIGCGPFLDTVEYESEEKNPPTVFGTIFQKTLCFLFPNFRNVFGKGTKFGTSLASRSFLQICKLAFFSITHPQKMNRVLKDSMYVMDQIGWITWKDPRDINGAHKELVSKLMRKGILSEFLNNEHLPLLALSTTKLFPNVTHAKEVIAVGREFYKALEQTKIIQNTRSLIDGPEKTRLKIIAPFIKHMITSDLLSKVNPETIEFLTTQLNNILVSQHKTALTTQEVRSLVDSGRQTLAILKQHGLEEQIEKLLVASPTERLDILQNTIRNPNVIKDLMTHLYHLEKTTEPIIRKVISDMNKTEQVQLGTLLWYEPDQKKFDLAFSKKTQDPDISINLNTQFNACSFGNAQLIGTANNPLNWTKVTARKFDMWGSKLEYVNFDGSQLTGYENPITSQWYFRGASFDHAKLKHCSLNGVNLKYAYMQDAEMAECQATNLDLTKSDMTYASLTSSRFVDTSFRETECYGMYITNCTMRNCDFSQAQCQYTVLSSTFEGTANFEKANLENAVFSGSSFKGDINFKGAILVNTDLENIKLDEKATINIDNAIISENALNQLKKQFPNQVKGIETATVLTKDSIAGLRKSKKTSTKIAFTERTEKHLKGILTGSRRPLR
ncbi:MAG: pentapeptide repeat-containing protein [Rickettsiales bacterium]|nr:pentapeptide repeat-containing protein [Rickettsiales bacterium]